MLSKQSKLKGVLFIAAMIVAAITAPSLIGTAEAKAVTRIDGRGTGTTTCGDGTTITSTTISIFADKKDTTKDFSGTVYIVDEFANIKIISVYSGKVSKAGLTLLGVEQQNDLCHGDPTPSKVTITGQCVEGTTVTYAAVNGETGTYPNSNVVCTSPR